MKYKLRLRLIANYLLLSLILLPLYGLMMIIPFLNTFIELDFVKERERFYYENSKKNEERL